MEGMAAGAAAQYAGRYRIVPSGFGFVDRVTGGFRLQKRYLFQAEAGVDRYVLALQMAHAGVQNGEVVVLVTAEDPEAVLLQAERLEIPLARVLHGDQFQILAYDRRFGEKVSNPAMRDFLLEDLRRKTNNRPINRAILLDEPMDVRPNVKVREALEVLETSLVEEHRAVACWVLPRDGGSSLCRDLQRSSFGWFTFRSEPDALDHSGVFRIEKEPSCGGGVVEYRTRIERGVGLVDIETPLQTVAVHYVGEDTRMLADLRMSLGASFDVQRHPASMRLPDAVESRVRPPVVVIESGAGFRDALGLVDELRRRGSVAPIFVLSRQVGRGADRAAMLRHGADDLLTFDTPLPEIRERVRRQVVRLGLLPQATGDLLRLESSLELPRTGDQGTVQWGVFKEHLQAQAESLKALGGHVTLVAIALRAAGTDAATLNAVASRLARDLVAILRSDDACALSPDGLLVARLYGVGSLELDRAIERMVERLRQRLAHAPATAELIVSTAVCPQDAGDVDDLYKQLLRPERRRYFPLAGGGGPGSTPSHPADLPNLG